ncbi:MAG: domain containing protein [Betaproteobacteria bacterium]|nr:domain containing protein [Betaproteobacteria bacterium]
MPKTYAALNSSTLSPRTSFAQPVQATPECVDLDNPALVVMTDLERVSAVLIRPDDTIREANLRMIQRGVRLLLVVDENQMVAGLITANDISGEKPLQAITERGGRREDIVVRDIMTPQDRLDVLDLQDVRYARVGHIVATLKESVRQHAVVVDVDANGRQRVRGLFSLTQIARQLGIVLHTSQIAHTFSEIETLLMH